MTSQVQEAIDRFAHSRACVRQAVKACGICHSTEDLLGPYCGGPFMWYCKNCKKIIDAFLDGQKRHRKFIKSLREKRKK